ncbi:MAG: HD domain-containing protein [Armatimonadetes bacterium]|nr:HD domain-containing protein [Armatimonadota bacterium]
MDATRRAEHLVANLRWLTFLVGAALVDHWPSAPVTAGLIGFCLAYNLSVLHLTRRRDLFVVAGRWLPWTCRLIDTALISVLVAHTGESESYLLYVFVLISTAYGSGSGRQILTATGLVSVANVLAMMYAAGPLAFSGSALYTLAWHAGAIGLAGLASVYLAKGRTYDERAAHQGGRLQALFECAGYLSDTRDINDMAQKVLRTAVERTSAGGGSLVLVEPESGELIDEAIIEDIKLSARDEEIVQTARSGAIEWVRSTGRELLIEPGEKSAETLATQTGVSIAAAPLVWTSHKSNEREVLGVLLIWAAPGASFHNPDLELVLALSVLASVGIVNLRLYTNLQTSFLRTLQSLAKSLEARDEYTQGHSERVTKLSCIIAERMNVPDEAVDMLRNAGPLHDIGKVGVPDAILTKPARLTNEEWEIMRRHPVMSEEICRPLGLSEEVLFLVRHHHERLDGKGYPDGLRAEDQPLLLRILAVADVFDALRSKRPYREPMTKEELIAEFNRCAGRIFDPTVVETIKTLIETGDLDYLYAEMDAEIGYVTSPELEMAA